MAAVTHAPITGFVISTKNTPTHNTVSGAKIRRIEMQKYPEYPLIIKGLNQFAAKVHYNAVAHGWWEEEPTFGDIIALCHCELSEAMEEYRKGKPMVYSKWIKYDVPCWGSGDDKCRMMEKPEGIAVELADCILRILDYCGAKDIDIELILEQKHRYNCYRSYKHGGKKL